MDRPTLEVADVFRRYGDAYRQATGGSLSTGQRRVMAAIEGCRTAALGGHVEACDACGHQRIAYHSCGNRHCPTCQSLARAAWIAHRTAEILDCEYVHLVFTVPADIAAIAVQNKAQVYGMLFRATAETVRTIAADPQHLGAEIGFFAVLHSWGQTLVHHPHLHGVVPGGGLSPEGDRWVACRPGFFLPVRVLSRLFRRVFLRDLHAAYDAGTLRLGGSLKSLRQRPAWTHALDALRQTEWVVYAKRPFAGPSQVVDDVGRYTHRVAISNNRLLDIEHGAVRFTYTDDRADPPPSSKTMTLTAPNSSAACCSTSCRGGCTASAMTASSARAIAERSWPVAGTCSAPPGRSRHPPTRRPRRIIAIGRRRSRAAPCGCARRAIRGT